MLTYKCNNCNNNNCVLVCAIYIYIYAHYYDSVYCII